MINPYVYIDDSGSPGANTGNEFYSESTKLYVAVIIKNSQKQKIEQSIIKKLKKIQKEYSEVKEFHFKDIYTGKKEFINMDSSLRLQIFEWFTCIYNQYRCPLIFSATSKKTLEKSGYSEGFINSKLDNFKMGNPGDFSLSIVIGMCDKYIEKYKNSYGKDNTPQIIVDAGRQKPNTTQVVRYMAPHIEEIEYKDSKNEILLQFADFFAFTINRIQNNYSKERSRFDNSFMEIVGNIHYNCEDNKNFITMKDINAIKNFTAQDHNSLSNMILKEQEKDRDRIIYNVDRTNNLCEKISELEKYIKNQ